MLALTLPGVNWSAVEAIKIDDQSAARSSEAAKQTERKG